MLGFPIRTPPDHSSFANSPGLIAGYNVLHRLSMPRHPPCALTCLPNKHSTNTTHKEQPARDNQPRPAFNTRTTKLVRTKTHTTKHPTHTRRPASSRSPCYARAGMLASTINKSNTKKPTNHTVPIQEPLGLMSQGPTVCQSQPTQEPATFHTQPKLCSTDNQPSHVKAFHRRFHYPNTTICLRHTRPERGACSLERR